MSRPHSIKRIVGWSGFLACALVAGLAVYQLPLLLNLDRFRPDFIDLLENTFHCHAEIGHVRAEFIPSPGLYVGRMTLITESRPPRVLASGSLHVALSWKSIWIRQLRFTSIRFMRPRILIHRELPSQGPAVWTMLTLPQTAVSGRGADVEQVDIRGGSLEVWDHATRPATRWVINGLNGSFQLRSQTGALTGKAPFLGPRSLLDLHYHGVSTFPLEAHVTQASLGALQTVLRSSFTALAGTAEAVIKVRLHPDLELRAALAPIELQRLPGVRLRGTFEWEGHVLNAHVESVTPAPTALTLKAQLSKQAWSISGDIKGYDAAVVQKLYDQSWLNRLTGGGTLTFSAQLPQRPGSWSWFAEGTGFTLADSPFRIIEWSAQGNPRTLVVDARPTTDSGGVGEVVWEHATGSPDAQLTVNLAAVTVRQILETFKLQSKQAAGGDWNPYGYEAWVVEKADMEAVIHDQSILEIQDSDIDLAGMHVDLAGTFNLKSSTSPAHIHGDILHVPLEPVLTSFAKPPASVTGQAQAGFDLTFPLNALWLRGFSGVVQVTAINGLLRQLKTLYRVMSVLNLTNYVRFRMPQVTADGVVFQSVIGQLRFQNGLLTTDDLFLKSSALNIGVKGAADLVEKRIDLTLRVELFRFLEEVLKAVPITHWIFKKPNKILLPLVVNVKGPWDNPDVY